MSWLYHFGKAFPEELKDIQNTGMLGSEKEGLAFLQAKAKETEMWSLLSTSLLSEAKLELQNVSHNLAELFLRLISLADHLSDRARALLLRSSISSSQRTSMFQRT
jgi:anaphase-promoting complex subunit 5